MFDDIDNQTKLPNVARRDISCYLNFTILI
jgi:hypothetical protein